MLLFTKVRGESTECTCGLNYQAQKLSVSTRVGLQNSMLPGIRVRELKKIPNERDLFIRLRLILLERI
jgi:hypothetical protein